MVLCIFFSGNRMKSVLAMLTSLMLTSVLSLSSAQAAIDPAFTLTATAEDWQIFFDSMITDQIVSPSGLYDAETFF